MELNIAENRNHLNYSKWVYVKRILWTFGKFFFRNSPRIAFGYRNTILRLFGAKIGKHVHIYSSTVIWFPWNLEIGDWSAIGEETLIYNLGKVTIGEKATVSHRVHVCAGTHDYTDPALPLLRPEIRIGNQTWICANTFIGPDIEIGEGAVIGAGTVMVKDAEPWGVYAGNPAKYIKKRIFPGPAGLRHAPAAQAGAVSPGLRRGGGPGPGEVGAALSPPRGVAVGGGGAAVRRAGHDLSHGAKARPDRGIPGGRFRSDGPRPAPGGQLQGPDRLLHPGPRRPADQLHGAADGGAGGLDRPEAVVRRGQLRRRGDLLPHGGVLLSADGRAPSAVL